MSNDLDRSEEALGNLIAELNDAFNEIFLIARDILNVDMTRTKGHPGLEEELKATISSARRAFETPIWRHATDLMAVVGRAQRRIDETLVSLGHAEESS